MKQHVIQTCRYLLLPVIRFLLKQGMSYAEFCECAKDAFVEAARSDYGIQGRPTNNSRVAMLTGLSRREVARVRDRLAGEDDDFIQGNRIARILSGWHTDEEFLDEDGKPAVLAMDGAVGSLDMLLKRYGGDLPHGAVVKELMQRGLVEEAAGNCYRVLRRDYVLSKLDPELIRQMGTALHDHAATLEHNLDGNRKMGARFEGIADNIMVSPKVAREFYELVESRGYSFLEEIDAWLAAREINESRDADLHTIRLGAGVYLIHNESVRGN